MVNAWSLAASVLNGTLDEDYPIMDKTKGRWDEDLTITSKESDEYDPIITTVEKAYDNFYGYKNDDGLDYEIDGWESDDDISSLSASSYYDDYMADIDDQRAHHFNYYGAGKLDYEPQ